MLFDIMVLNNDVVKNNDDYIGDPTEIALYECLENLVDIDKLRQENERIGEIPFDSNRKMMSTINKSKNRLRLYTKGSFDSLINCCSYILENNEIIKLTNDKIDLLKSIEEEEANKAYRVLA